MSSTFTIVRILPDMLGVNGSAANAEIVGASVRAMGHEVSVIDVFGPHDVAASVDLVCVGSGSGSSVSPAASALISLVPALAVWQNQGALFFSVGTGWDLLGRQLMTSTGEVIPGAGIYPSTADHSSGRINGEVSGKDYRGREVAGYINQVGSSVRDEGVAPLWTIEAGGGDAPRAEGLVSDALRATRLGGPALALNPHWCDDIVAEMLMARGMVPVTTDFHARVVDAASQARAHIIRRLGFSRQ